MVSEDSEELHPMHSAVPAASIHGERGGSECIEAFGVEVLPSSHRPDDAGECREVLTLRAQKGLSFEERNDPRQQVVPLADDQHQRGVVASPKVLANPSAAEALLDEVEDLTPFCVLADVELWNQLPSQCGAGIPADRHMERSFSVDEARDVGIQPFLLIVRTGWIFTAHRRTISWWCDSERVPPDTRSFQHLAEFIDSAEIHCLATF
jgi:hypothetical protein